MASFIIEGGHRLNGDLIPQGAKNEALEVLCATLLTPEEVKIYNIPDILDVNNLIQLLRDLGVTVKRIGLNAYSFKADKINLDYLDSDEFFQKGASLRGSVMIIGPLVARFGYAVLPKPGRQARLPVPKSLDGYDFANVRLPDGYAKEQLTGLDFAAKAQDLVFYGKTGRGKTHLATALGMIAVEQGRSVRFRQTAELVLQLGKAKRDGALDSLLRDLARADLIILDEFGYVPFDIDGARLLYQIIAGSYERRSIIFTTNIEFSKWGTIFADDKLAAAIIDRIVHHGRLIEFTGPSRRVSQALMFGKTDNQ